MNNPKLLGLVIASSLIYCCAGTRLDLGEIRNGPDAGEVQPGMDSPDSNQAEIREKPTFCDQLPKPTYEILRFDGRSSYRVEVGSGQGIQIIENNIYLYGDNNPGVAIELNRKSMKPTGWAGSFTQDGVDLVNHPTGIAYREGFPTFIAGGSIYSIDWDLFYAEQNLDHAILHRIDINGRGQRPEYVVANGQWYVATMQYDPDSTGNEILLLDPAALAEADSLEDPGVIVERFPGPSQVQDLFRLVLVQNLKQYQGWKLTEIDLEKALLRKSALGEAIEKTTCFASYDSYEAISYLGAELEGYARLATGEQLFLTVPPDGNNNFFVIAPH